MANLQDVIAAIERQRSNDPEMLKQLQDINNKLDSMTPPMPSSASGRMSQGRARDAESERRFGRRTGDVNDEDYEDRMERHRPNRGRSSGLGLGGIFDGFTDGLEEQLLQGIRGSSFGSMISASLADFANAVGVEIKDLPNGLGQLAGRQLANAFKSTPMGKDISDALTNVKTQLADRVNSALGQAAGRILGRQSGGAPEQASPSDLAATANNMQDLASQASGTAEGLPTVQGQPGVGGAPTGQSAELAQAGAQQAGQQAAQEALTKSMTKLGVYGLIIIAALKVADVALSSVKKSVDEAKQSINKTKKAITDASNRNALSASKALASVNERIKADYEELIKTPFKILEDSAKSVQTAWDNTMQTITATQGYSKAELQDLMSVYAQRLRTDTEFGDLTRVVSVADMTENLKKVLESGLSGQVAEEFAYLATILNRAIPTEDFFGYASTYASIAANAIQAGQSQADAIEYANDQLKQFASNVLYASREVAGGFSTGLKDASSLLESSVKIANAAKTGNAANISGVLTSASAIIGAVAPDLASSLVDNIVSAATGGNAEAIASLRSLAGVGASNTEFIRALASDPQKVFSNLFDRLATLQKMSNDNFMEVAEGLSNVFGVSMDAFARVDFNYLADSIRNMSVDMTALSQNVELLQSGQTTSTADQMRMQQINEYILEEGLSYVLDNELARMVQEHMWQQEQTKALQETTYGVNLIGSAMETLLSLYNVVKTIVTILNPLSWGVEIANAVSAIVDYASLGKDVDAAISAAVVGVGNKLEYSMLTDRNLLNAQSTAISEQIISNYTRSLGFASKYIIGRNAFDGATAALGFLSGGTQQSPMSVNQLIDRAIRQSGIIDSEAWKALSRPAEYSTYRTDELVGKSAASSRARSNYQYTAIADAQQSAQTAIDNKMKKSISDFTSGAAKWIESENAKGEEANLSYAEWIKSSGMTQETFEQYGISSQQLENIYQSAIAAEGSKEVKKRAELQDEFFKNAFPEFVKQEHRDLTEIIYRMQDQHFSAIESKLEAVDSSINKYIDSWTDYYINNIDYISKTFDPSTVADIANAEKGETGDAVLALANALTANDLQGLQDPVVQQNVLLAQILKTVQAIMQQNNEAATVSLPTTLSSLGLGLTNTSY